MSVVPEPTNQLTCFVEELARDCVVCVHLARLDGDRRGRLPVRIQESSFVDVAELPVANDVVKLDTIPVDLVITRRTVQER